MTVKTMLEKYPDAQFDFMTCCGYVTLTAEGAKALLAGEPTFGHPGFPGTWTTITAEELLTQEIHAGQWDGNVFYGITDWIRNTQSAEQTKKFEESEGWKMGGIS